MLGNIIAAYVLSVGNKSSTADQKAAERPMMIFLGMIVLGVLLANFNWIGDAAMWSGVALFASMVITRLFEKTRFHEKACIVLALTFLSMVVLVIGTACHAMHLALCFW